MVFLHQVLSTYQIFPYKIKWWNSNILEYYVLAKDNVNFIHTRINSTGKYMFKANSRKTKTRWEICSKLTIKTLERRYWHLYCGLWTYFTPCPSVFLWAGKYRLAGNWRKSPSWIVKLWMQVNYSAKWFLTS